VNYGDMVYYRIGIQDCNRNVGSELLGKTFPALVIQAYSAAERTDENDDQDWARKTFSGVADLNVFIPGKIWWVPLAEEDYNPTPSPNQYGGSIHVIPEIGKFIRNTPPSLI
jgi:hypothetical protein